MLITCLHYGCACLVKLPIPGCHDTTSTHLWKLMATHYHSICIRFRIHYPNTQAIQQKHLIITYSPWNYHKLGLGSSQTMIDVKMARRLKLCLSSLPPFGLKPLRNLPRTISGTPKFDDMALGFGLSYALLLIVVCSQFQGPTV